MEEDVYTACPALESLDPLGEEFIEGSLSKWYGEIDMPSITHPQRISLLNNPDISEKMIQEEIAKDPSILGLGDLILKDKERSQPRAGRLDLLLQDSETQRRYEVEIQLGKTDESHIIRTIEYWDTERKRYPQYDHCAVIIAEDVTARFHNVISLFNGSIPIIAIQMNAFKSGESGDIILLFTKVLDEFALGTDEEDEIIEATDRSYWINRSSESTVQMADKLLAVIQEFASGHELNYTKGYIGLAKDGRSRNFVLFKPKRSALNVEIKLPYTEEIQKVIDDSGIDDMEYQGRWGVYRVRLHEEDVEKYREVLKELFQKAHENLR